MRYTQKGVLLTGLLVVASIGVLYLLFQFSPRRQQSVTAPAAAWSVMTPTGKEELEKFQGFWGFASLEVDGDAKPEADFKKYTVEFKGDQWIVSEGTNVAAQSTIVVDPTTDPKSIDAFPPPVKGLPIHGIYLFEGDKLTICDRGEDNGDRPTDFSTEPNSGLVLIVFKRVQR